ncbi:hypothetical protein QZH41_002994 [Actinostola sp. cb2023]|nr:hypothetical protein QZH41_002994 [Actinostola sp. cb2023]
MDYIFGDLGGVSGIADDTFIFGDSETKHDNHILNVLDLARQNNIRFNPDKFQFKVAEASFFGLKWTPEGLKVDEKKVQAIVNMQPPKDLKGIQSFMGMINYLNRFSPVLAQIAEPIRNLMKKDAPFLWQAEQEKAFQQIKGTISKSPLLPYYDPEKESVIQSDARMHDYYSKFPVVRKLNTTTSTAVINHLKSIFAEYGIPETLVTDNGPQYHSKEFQTFCSTWGIEHTTSSPLFPQSNGFSERMILKKLDMLIVIFQMCGNA